MDGQTVMIMMIILRLFFAYIFFLVLEIFLTTSGEVRQRNVMFCDTHRSLYVCH